jgi:NTE family protein
MPGLLEILWRVGTIGSDSKIGSDFRRCDVLLVPKVQHIRLLDWRSHQQAVEAGYRAALEQLPDLATRLSKASNGPIRSATALASG